MVFCRIQLKAQLQYPTWLKRDWFPSLCLYKVFLILVLSAVHTKIMIEQVHCHSSVNELNVKSQFRQKNKHFFMKKYDFQQHTLVLSLYILENVNEHTGLVPSEYLSCVSLRLGALTTGKYIWNVSYCVFIHAGHWFANATRLDYKVEFYMTFWFHPIQLYYETYNELGQVLLNWCCRKIAMLLMFVCIFEYFVVLLRLWYWTRIMFYIRETLSCIYCAGIVLMHKKWFTLSIPIR